MPDDLGARLLRAGLVTRDQLGDTLASGPPHDGALVAALVARGVPEDALAGFFLAEGFGPLMDPGDLAKADPAALRRVAGAMAGHLLALPVRASPAGLVVAMAAPSDRHAVRELARAIGGDVLPTVACVGPLLEAIRTAFPEQGRQDAAERAREAERERARGEPATAAARGESEPPVLELVRRRKGEASAAESSIARAPLEPRGATTLGPKLVADDEDEAAVPLVRTKPQGTPAAGITAPAKLGGRVITKSFARPESTRKGPLPHGEAFAERNTAEYPRTPDEDARALEAATPARADAVSAARLELGANSATAAASKLDAPKGDGVRREALDAPAMPGGGLAEPMTPAPVRRSSGAEALRPASIVPPEHERWDLGAAPAVARSSAPPSRAAAAASRRASAALPPAKVAPAEIGTVLSAMRAAQDRDEVVRLACEGTITVARAAVFLALRKEVLKGWDAEGAGLSRDAVRNLWIPTTSPSSFKRVIEARAPHVGPYGTSIADGLFRAAVASRGGDAILQPVIVGEKVVAVLCADDVVAAPIGPQRIEVLAHAVGEAFRRILAGKRG